MKLDRNFYERENVVFIARELIGKILFTRIDRKITAGIITETEAYAGETDRASHAFSGRRTARTEIMYQPGGTAYVYLCYGIHSLFNIVTNKRDIPHAVLVRAVLPKEGLDLMKKRKKNFSPEKDSIVSGPGSVSKILGIHFSQSGISLSGKEIWLEDHGIVARENKIIAGPRIGVDYAGRDALLPYRFRVLNINDLAGA